MIGKPSQLLFQRIPTFYFSQLFVNVFCIQTRQITDHCANNYYWLADEDGALKWWSRNALDKNTKWNRHEAEHK